QPWRGVAAAPRATAQTAAPTGFAESSDARPASRAPRRAPRPVQTALPPTVCLPSGSRFGPPLVGRRYFDSPGRPQSARGAPAAAGGTATRTAPFVPADASRRARSSPAAPAAAAPPAAPAGTPAPAPARPAPRPTLATTARRSPAVHPPNAPAGPTT